MIIPRKKPNPNDPFAWRGWRGEIRWAYDAGWHLIPIVIFYVIKQRWERY